MKKFLLFALVWLIVVSGCKKEGSTPEGNTSLKEIINSNEFRMLSNVVGKTKHMINHGHASADSGKKYTENHVVFLQKRFPELMSDAALRQSVIEALKKQPGIDYRKIDKQMTTSSDSTDCECVTGYSCPCSSLTNNPPAADSSSLGGYASSYSSFPYYMSGPSYVYESSSPSSNDWLNSSQGVSSYSTVYYGNPLATRVEYLYRSQINGLIEKEMENNIRYEFAPAQLPIVGSAFTDAIIDVEGDALEGFRLNLSHYGTTYGNGTPTGLTDDDPFIEWLREQLRLYFRLTPPKDEAQAAEIEHKRSVLITKLEQWRAALDVYKESYSMAPGVGAVVDYYDGNYGSAATSAALDIFGASLIKAPFRVGISLIRVSDLAARMPQIATILKSLRVVEIKLLVKSGSQEYAIIGETMHRVIVTDNISFKLFGNQANVHRFEASKDALLEWNDDLKKYGHLTPDQVTTSRLYKENVDWITDMKNRGVNIIDLNIDPIKDFRSSFYNMEKTVIYK